MSTKKCPLCAEEIQSEAIKCKHCGSNLVTATQNVASGVEKGERKEKERPQPSSFTIGCLSVLVGIVLLIVIGSFLPSSQKQPNVVTESEHKQEDATEPDNSLGITPAEFKTRFNEAFRKINWNLRMHPVSTTSDSDNVAQIFDLNRNIAFTLNSSKKSGKVTSVWLLGQGNGTLKSGADLILAIGVLIETVNPELPPEDRGQLLNELCSPKGDTSKPTFDGTATRNGVAYGMSTSKDIPFMLVINKTGS